MPRTKKSNKIGENDDKKGGPWRNDFKKRQQKGSTSLLVDDRTKGGCFKRDVSVTSTIGHAYYFSFPYPYKGIPNVIFSLEGNLKKEKDITQIPIYTRRERKGKHRANYQI
jgi:hypothetical protein